MMHRTQDFSRILEQLESRPSLSLDEKTRESLFRLQSGASSAHVQYVAKKAWRAVRDRIRMLEEEGREISTDMPVPEAISLEEWKALQLELETERIKYGEITPRVQEFLETRETVQRSIRKNQEKFQTQYTLVTNEGMGKKEKQESPLYTILSREINGIAQELGIVRPVEVEVLRQKELNAFVLSVAREGGVNNTDVPLRVFVNAGFIVQLNDLLRKKFNKPLTMDHVAVVLGHELRHLQQVGRRPDGERMDPDEQQRYEYDADAAGFEAADRIGRNPRAGLEMFEAMKAGSYSALATHYLTQSHPITENRIKELEILFRRPDRPFFSSDVEMEVIPTSILEEAKQLVREPLHERLKECKSIFDWETLVDDIERDPKTSLVDVKILGQMLRPVLDQMMALSAARHALETDCPVQRAILLRANYIWQTCVEDIMRDTPTFPKSSDEAPWHFIHGETMNYADPSPPVMNKDERTIEEIESMRPDEFWIPNFQKKYFAFYATYGTNFKTIDSPAFQSMNQLFDPTNQHAQMLWRWVYRHSNEKNDPVEHARKDAQETLANAIIYEAKGGCSFDSEDLTEHESHWQTIADKLLSSGRDPSNGVSAFPTLGDITSRVRANIGHSRVPDAPSNTLPLPQPRRRRSVLRTFEARALRVPQGRFPVERIASESEIPENLPLFDRLIWKYLRLSRRTLDHHFDPQNLHDRFDEVIEVSNGAKDKLFRELFYDYIVRDVETQESGWFAKRTSALPFTNETITQCPGYAEALPFMPFIGIQNPGGHDANGMHHSTNCLDIQSHINYRLGLAQDLDSVEGIAKRFEQITRAIHHPFFQQFYIAHSGQKQDEHWEQGDAATPDVIAKRGHALLDLKRRLFVSLIDISVRASGFDKEGAERGRTKILRNALKERAAHLGIPENIFEIPRVRTFFFRKEPTQLSYTERNALAEILVEEYLKNLAENTDEMSSAADNFSDFDSALSHSYVHTS